jgi:hypothetical protein
VLARTARGHGYATEAELAALRRIGMTTDPAEDFDPDVDEGRSAGMCCTETAGP